MFVRLDKDVPADPSYRADITALGYKLDEQGEFVKINNPTGPRKHFTFFISDDERVNEVHKESMHIGVRDVVAKELACLGVRPRYLTGKDGTVIEESKPETNHVTLFTTDLDGLKGKKNVVVVVGEHNQDPGIFAYRVITREGGIEKGSAVGMVKRLHTMGFGTAASMSRDNLSVDSNFSNATTAVEAGVAPNVVSSSAEDTSPGIIILNPGQRLYSPAEEKCMTWTTWHARHRPNALSKGFKVDQIHNQVPGHKSAEEHIATVFDHVIPQLVSRAASIQVIAITDGAEGFIKWLNNAMEREDVAVWDKESVTHQIRAMAFMEPTHNPASVTVEAARLNLKYDARSYIKSASPLGRFINSPDAMKDFRSDEEKEEDRVDAEARTAKIRTNREVKSLAQDGSHAGEEPVMVEEVSARSGDVPVVGEEAVEVPANIGEDGIATPDGSSDASSERRGMNALGRSIEEFKAREAGESMTSSLTALSIPSNTDSLTSTSAEDPYSPIANSEVSERPPMAWEPDYDYANTLVSCPTFSSGIEDIDELILPNVMESVVEWLSWRAVQEMNV